MAVFLLRHTWVYKETLSKQDTYFRKIVNNKIGGIPLTKDTFYIQAKDGNSVGSVSETDTTYAR
jgi:hypothetical protein